MKPHRVGEGERSLAVFIDFENMGLGFNNRRDRFEISKVLERLVEKGKIVCKKAYADWSRFGMYTGGLHEAAIELIEIPRRGMSGKNSADIRLVVDAIDLAYSKDHIDTFVIVSGDSDFSPLVSKLKELGKHVIGLGLADATSDLLRDNCDEFIYYEDLDRAPIIPVAVNDQIPEKKRKVFALLLDSLLALRRENKEVIYSSMLKDTIKRKKPSFNEEYYGYRTFSELLEDAQKEELLEIEKHKSSGMYVVTRFGLEMQTGAPSVVAVVRNGNEGRRAVEAPKLAALPTSATASVAPKPTAPVLVVVKPALLPDRREERPEPPRSRGPERSVTPAKPPVPVNPVKPVAVPASAVKPAIVPQPIKPAVRQTTPLTPPSSSPPGRTLGRALVDDLDDLDDLDDVPSYSPGKPVAKPTAPVAKAAPAPKPVQRAVPTPKTPAKPKPVSPAKQVPPVEAPVQRKPVTKAVPVPKPAPKPVTEEDEFGAGIGD
ncbi:MAG: hypothetical protein C0467_07140 [Planctomycetaceae bacterium]|nr:hypothetical protein [Planctomycetaceae bacterium]